MENQNGIIVESGIVNTTTKSEGNEMTNQTKIMLDAQNLEGKKVLYFEGAGMEFYEEAEKYSDVGNFRIRTSFLNNEGKQIYLEMGNAYRRNNKGKTTSEMALWIDFCFEVPSNKDEEIKYDEIYKRHIEHLEIKKLNYTKDDITKWINERLNCNFDTIHVLNRFYGYYVHGKHLDSQSTYNLMENIELNHERAEKRSQAYNNAMEYYKNTRKFPCLSVLQMLDDGLEIKCNAYKSELKGLEQVKVFTV